MVWVFTAITLFFLSGTSAADQAAPLAPGTRYLDPLTIQGEKNFLTGYPPLTKKGRVNVVVEVPSGTNAKWEVSKPDGLLRWEEKKGRPRVVKYLSYPANYGMVPGTLLPKELGGDGDPLDVLVLGRAHPRGSVLPVKLIGVLKLLDKGEQDDKLIAVPANGVLSAVDDLGELDKKFPGVKEIVETWFKNYKGPGKIETLGYANQKEARKILQTSIQAFQKSAKD